MNDVAAGMEKIAEALGPIAPSDPVEWFEPDDPRQRNAETKIGLRRLADGGFVTYVGKFWNFEREYPDRAEALHAALAAAISHFEALTQTPAGMGTRWEPDYAARAIAWARSLAPWKDVVSGGAEGKPATGNGLGSGETLRASLQNSPGRLDAAAPEPNAPSSAPPLTASSPGLLDSGQPAPPASGMTKEKRTSWPPGHTVTMTREYPEDGEALNVGTCQCGEQWKFPVADKHVQMDAAIEAHWAAFDGTPGPRHDGRGEPVSTNQDQLIQRKKQRVRKKKQPDATPAGAVVAARSGATAGETAPIPEAPTTPGAPEDAAEIAIEWPSYDKYLEDKIVTAPLRGIEVARAALHPWLKPHCKDLTLWALRLGCAAIFANFGLHKTAMQLEWCRQLHRNTGKPTLSVLPLGVRHGFIKEAACLDMQVMFIRTTAEYHAGIAEGLRHFLTNYESIREGKLDPHLFAAVSLDEASVLRSYGSKTFQEFLPLFAKVPFKLVATATPSPNRYKELIHYSGFLGVMDTGQALTRFFQRDSEKAGNLTLYPHKEDEFWMWVHSWAAFLQKPSDLGHDDSGYELPPLKVTWHEVPADHSKAAPERNGQHVLFRNAAAGLSQAAASKRDSLPVRIAKMQEIIAQDPAAHRLLWHDLEKEREAIEAAVPGVVAITGTGMDLDERERLLAEFEEGRVKYFATKPILSGSGSNFQYHCHKAIFLGVGYKFNDFIQACYRIQRFGQAHEVEIDIIYSEDERDVRAVLEKKWAADTTMRARMSEIIRAHGLDALPLRDSLARSIGVKRVEVKGAKFICINNDAVAEARTWPDNSVAQIVTSVPFGNHYQYAESYNDFGHTDDNAHFWGQMDFLTVELIRMLQPGRLACIHVKDRVLFGAVTGEGVPTISPFHAEAIMHYRAHGFQYLGMITVVTDVVRENNQTYRLGWSECCKDGSKMGVGSPEYILLMRKPQSDKTRAYADVPIVKQKRVWVKFQSDGFVATARESDLAFIEEHEVLGEADDRQGPQVEGDYSRTRWQIDAHAFWRSSGNRLLTAEEFADCSSADLAKLFAKTSAARTYDYEAHVKIGETIERTGTLPATFMAIAPGSNHPEVWTDINRMRTLNMNQERRGSEMHVCPLQLDIVDRLIERYSNPGELIYDPFGGLMTVPYRAILKGRRGAATELNADYFLDGVHYCRMAEEQVTTPQLFDLAKFDAANIPPRT